MHRQERRATSGWDRIRNHMKKMKGFLKKTAALSLAAVTAAVSIAPALAATSASPSNNTATQNDLANYDIIDWKQKGSLTIHKYDITAAEAAGAYKKGTFEATGQQNKDLEDTMADYAIEGVQFSYLRVGTIENYSFTNGDRTTVRVVYEIPEELAGILELSTEKTFEQDASIGYTDISPDHTGVAKPCDREGVFHYTSTQINDALQGILTENDIAAKNALEGYLYEYGTLDSTTDQSYKTSADTGVAAVNMSKTDKNGVTKAENLDLGLYLLVETEVPENVTETVNPFFVSLPFTNLTDADDVDDTQGGSKWVYDAVLYPKNQTGNPTLDKSVRNAYSNTTASADKNGTVNAGDDYVSANDSSALVVYNDDTNAKLPKDTDDAAYVANRGGYTTDGTTAGKDGAGYSRDFEYGDTTTASAGDVLDYILVSKLPHITSKATFISEYTFVDTLSRGLTYNHDVKVAFYDNAADANANNTKNAVLKWDLASDTYAQQYADVTVTNPGTGAETGDGTTQLTVSLTEAGLKAVNGVTEAGYDADDHTKIDNVDVDNAAGLSDYYMVVYYTATVNSDASLVLGDEGNPNDVMLTWSRTSDGYYNTLTDRNYVYAYSIDLTKTFSDGKGDMKEVEFKLYNETDAYYVVAEQDEATGIYYVTGKSTSEDKATTFIPTEDGSIVVYGLEADSYQATEIATDDGYTLLEDQIVIAIKATDREVIASVAGVTGLDKDAVAAMVDAYAKGIFNENGDKVNAATDALTGAAVAGPAAETANGRPIGKTDMYVGDVVPATATVDNVAATMAAQDASDNATVLMSVMNNSTFTLPQTGGFGTLLFTLAGCGAAFVGIMVVTKKKDKENSEA